MRKYLTPFKIITSAFLFILSQGLTGQINQIGADIDGETTLNFSGRSVAVSGNGNILAIGAPFNNGNGSLSGHVRVYELVSGSWVQLGGDIDGENSGAKSGSAVSLSFDGLTLAIGSPSLSINGVNTGSVRVFTWNSNNWVQLGNDIVGATPGEEFGASLALSKSGNRIIIGAPKKSINGVPSGEARIYELVSGAWSLVGNALVGLSTDEQFGFSVSINGSGDRVAIGAPQRNDSSAVKIGAVEIYELLNNSWVAVCAPIFGESGNDESGTSIMITQESNRIIIGAPKNSGSSALAGHARVYDVVNGNVIQIGSDIDGESAVDFSGRSVAINSNGNSIAIGAFYNDGNGFDAGQVRYFELSNGNWIQRGTDLDGEALNDFSGVSISMSSRGNILAVGADHNDGNGPESGHVRVYNACFDSIISHPINFTSFVNPGWAMFTISCSDTSSEFQWESNDGTGWSQMTDGLNVIGSKNDTLQLQNITLGMNNTRFRCIVSHCRIDTTQEAFLEVINGLNNPELNGFNLISYPNPSQGRFTVTIPSSYVNGIFDIYDSSGKALLHGDLKNRSMDFDLSDWPRGSYQFQVRLNASQINHVFMIR